MNTPKQAYTWRPRSRRDCPTAIEAPGLPSALTSTPPRAANRGARPPTPAFHAPERRRSCPTCRRPRYRYRLKGAVTEPVSTPDRKWRQRRQGRLSLLLRRGHLSSRTADLSCARGDWTGRSSWRPARRRPTPTRREEGLDQLAAASSRSRNISMSRRPRSGRPRRARGWRGPGCRAACRPPCERARALEREPVRRRVGDHDLADGAIQQEGRCGHRRGSDAGAQAVARSRASMRSASAATIA